MRLRKIYISVYLIVAVTFLIMIVSMSFTIFGSIKTVRTDELYGADIEKFRHLENIIESIDDKAKSTCVAQMMDYDNSAVMYSQSYDARHGVAALMNIKNIVMADSDIQSAYVYNNKSEKYIGIAVDEAETEKNIFDEIRRNYNGKIPRLIPIPRKVARYGGDNMYNVISYLAYDDIDEDDVPIGAIIMNLKIDRIIAAAKNTTGGNSQIIILDSNNSVIVDTLGKTDFLGKADSKIFDAARRSREKEAPEFCYVNGEKKVINSFTMKCADWKYINVVNYNDYFSAIYEIGRRIFVMAVLFVIIAAVASIYIAKIIAVPINNFIIKINAITNTDDEAEFKSKRKMVMPANMLNNYFADAVIDFREHFKFYANGKRSEKLRDCILFGNTDEVNVKGYMIMYEIYNMQVGEIYLSHVFNMVKTYIESSVEDSFDFIVLDKRHALAIIDMPIEKVRSICMQATEDARLCDVTLSAFIGHYQMNAESLQKEMLLCQSMARYQLTREMGFVYDYMQYEADENKKLCFSASEMNAVINKIIVSTDDGMRRAVLKEYLKSVSDNSVENFIAIYSRLMNAVQEIFGRILPEHMSEFTDINMAMSTAETYGEVVNLIGKVAEIASEAYLKQYGRKESKCEDIREYIRNNIVDTQLSPSVIAREFGVSQRKISHDFKEESGRSLAEEINVIRLKKVEEMLLTTEEPIKSIMQKCGFTNESNFYKLFKKYHHVTPNDYKRYVKKGNL